MVPFSPIPLWLQLRNARSDRPRSKFIVIAELVGLALAVVGGIVVAFVCWYVDKN